MEEDSEDSILPSKMDDRDASAQPPVTDGGCEDIPSGEDNPEEPSQQPSANPAEAFAEEVVLYDREVCLEIQSPQQAKESGASATSSADSSRGAYEVVGDLETVVFKLLETQSDGSDSTKLICVEISKESDLFFLLKCEISSEEFRDLKTKQNLTIDFDQFSAMLIDLFNKCREPSDQHVGVLTYLTSDVENSQVTAPFAELEFSKNLDFKMITLMKLKFRCECEENIRKHAHVRYNVLKSRLALAEAKLQEVFSLIRENNPSLALDVSRMPRSIRSPERAQAKRH